MISVDHHREGMAVPVYQSEIELTLAMRDEHHCCRAARNPAQPRLPGRAAQRRPWQRGAQGRDRALRRSRRLHVARRALDPEDVEAILRPYHERLRAELERYGGTVEKFIGDAVMALFGAPVAHEDDPERAVRAALAIRDWAREEGELEVRVGVTTGEALVSLDARPERGEGMAAGDVVNTAARLQAAAPVERHPRRRDDAPGDRARDRVPRGRAGRGEGQGRAGARVGGGRGARPLRRRRRAASGRRSSAGAASWTLLRRRARARPGAARAAARDARRRARDRQEPARLRALRRVVDAEPELVYWRQGRSLPYGEGVTYWALARDGEGAGRHPRDGLGRGSRAEARASGRAASQSERPERLLAAAASARRPRSRTRKAAASAPRRSPPGGEFFEALAEQRPTVLVFEDLHWADDDLLDFVDHLVDWSTGVPLLVVCTARPELLERRPGWGGGKPNALTISLAPLSDDETARLLVDACSSARCSRPRRRRRCSRGRAGTRSTPSSSRVCSPSVAARTSELPLPENVQGIIAARLDALPREPRRRCCRTRR